MPGHIRNTGHTIYAQLSFADVPGQGASNLLGYKTYKNISSLPTLHMGVSGQTLVGPLEESQTLSRIGSYADRMNVKPIVLSTIPSGYGNKMSDLTTLWDISVLMVSVVVVFSAVKYIKSLSSSTPKTIDNGVVSGVVAESSTSKSKERLQLAPLSAEEKALIEHKLKDPHQETVKKQLKSRKPLDTAGLKRIHDKIAPYLG